MLILYAICGSNPLSQLDFQLKTAEYVHLKQDICSQSFLSAYIVFWVSFLAILLQVEEESN